MEQDVGPQVAPLWDLSEFTARAVEDPVPRASLCSVGTFALVNGPDRDEGPRNSALLTLPLPEDIEATVDWTSLRVFLIDEKEPGFSLVERSGFERDRRLAWAEVDAPGLYGVYALPADPAVRDAVWWLRELQPLIEREATAGGDRLRATICELILCQNPHFDPPQGICERCLGLEMPPGGMPEFQLLRHERRPPQLQAVSPCRLVNGPIVLLESNTNNLVTAPSPLGLSILCASPGLGELLKPPKWSPGGERLVYAVRASPTTSRLETRDASCGGARTVVTGPGNFAWVDWNPVKVGNQYEIAFSVIDDATGLSSIDAILEDGTGRRTLVAAGAYVGTERALEAWCPAYAPDGTTFAYLARLARSFSSELVLVVTDPSHPTGHPRYVSPASAREPVVWTPDGQFVGSRTVLAQNPQQTGWWFFPVAGGTVIRAPLAVADPSVTFLAFAPDGLKVCGTRTTPAASDELFVADVDPQFLTLTNAVAVRRNARVPDWGPICV